MPVPAPQVTTHTAHNNARRVLEHTHTHTHTVHGRHTHLGHCVTEQAAIVELAPLFSILGFAFREFVSV